MKQLSIIYVNFHSERLIADSISSFFPHTSLQLEIIIVDNSNSEEEIKQLISNNDSIIYINAGYNAGFARANNLGIRRATANQLLLLNPDTILQPDVLDKLYEEFLNSPYIAAGVQLLNEDLSPQISGNYFIKGGINHFLPLPIIGKFLKSLGTGLNVKKTNLPDSNSTTKVDWINGAFVLIHMDAIKKAGLLDEDFFLYAEEIEWCSRLSKIGPLAIFGAFKVIHLEGASSNNAFDSKGKGYYNLYDRKGLQIMVSNFLRIRKQYGLLWFLLHIWVYTLELPLLIVSNFFRTIFNYGKFPKGLISGYRKNLWQLYKLLPNMISNRPYFYKIL